MDECKEILLRIALAVESMQKDMELIKKSIIGGD